MARELDLGQEAALDQVETEDRLVLRARGALAEARKDPDKPVRKSGKYPHQRVVMPPAMPGGGHPRQREFAVDEAREIQPQVPWLWKRG